MKQDIVVEKEDYITITEEEYISNLKVSYKKDSLGTYQPMNNYLQIHIGEGLSLYIEIDGYEMEKILNSLKKDVEKVRYGFSY